MKIYLHDGDSHSGGMSAGVGYRNTFEVLSQCLGFDSSPKPGANSSGTVTKHKGPFRINTLTRDASETFGH